MFGSITAGTPISDDHPLSAKPTARELVRNPCIAHGPAANFGVRLRPAAHDFGAKADLEDGGTKGLHRAATGAVGPGNFSHESGQPWPIPGGMLRGNLCLGPLHTHGTPRFLQYAVSRALRPTTKDRANAEIIDTTVADGYTRPPCRDVRWVCPHVACARSASGHRLHRHQCRHAAQKNACEPCETARRGAVPAWLS